MSENQSQPPQAPGSEQAPFQKPKALSGVEGPKKRGLSTQWMIFIGGTVGLLTLVVVLWGVYHRGEVEKKAAEVIGTVGVQSRQGLSREAGINLPIADQAKPGAAEPGLTVEVPMEYGKDLPGSETRLNERFTAIADSVRTDPTVQAFEDTITIRVDRDLEYRNLVQAVVQGQANGFSHFQIACKQNALKPETGYLDIDLPTTPVFGKNVLLFRLVKQGDNILYVFGISTTKEYTRLSQAAQVMKNTTSKGADKLLVIEPSIDIPVQNVIEALNAASYAGFQRITFSRPPKLY